MATQRVNHTKPASKRRAPARTPEERENQMIGIAVDAAEDLMSSGNAPAQIITHYLKLGSSREKLEQERLRNEVSLLQIKRETIASQQRVEELYGKALEAMQAYSGQKPQAEYDED